MEKYIVNVLQCQNNEGRNFFKMEGGRLAYQNSFELVKEEIINFKFLLEESKREEICIMWRDQQLCDITCLISHNIFLEYYLLKKN